MKYEVRHGARGIKVGEPDRLVQEFLALQTKLGRPPLPEDIVETARKGRSTFHSVFERAGLWDDKHAAEIARVQFARYILRAITVRIEATEGAVEHAAFMPLQYVDGEAEPGSGYMTTEEVLRDELMARTYLRRLQREAGRLAEEARAWEWLIKTVAPAQDFVAAATALSESPI